MAIIGSPLGLDGSVAHDAIVIGNNGTIIAALADSVASLATDVSSRLLKGDVKFK
jgi:hypothetical protein